jgi:Ca2+-binding RTX toxin-like protein
MATITGTNAGNNLNGTSLADQILGLGGDDILIGFDGDDALDGGKGADQLFGSSGFDTASYRGSPFGVTISLRNSTASGGDAAGDALYSIEGLRGSAFADYLEGDSQRNVIRGEGGADTLQSFEGNDTLDGGAGDDFIFGGDGNDQLSAGDGNDTLVGGAGNDQLRGGGGIDTAIFSGSAVLVDLKEGSAVGSDTSGSDRVSGIENVVGTFGGDLIGGNAGANVLRGDLGGDVLRGDGGADRFVYANVADSTPKGADQILDFSRAQGDRIDLRDVDANEQAGGNQAFTFIGQAPFTGAGQLQFYQGDGRTFIEANTTDATPGAELRIVLELPVSVQAGDFLL